jgi:hypothetical protein
MRSVFPSVFIVDVPGTINSIVFASADHVSRQTVIANFRRSTGTVGAVAARALSYLRPAPSSSPIFTDDLAPVEQLVDQIILDYAQQRP